MVKDLEIAVDLNSGGQLVKKYRMEHPDNMTSVQKLMAELDCRVLIMCAIDGAKHINENSVQ